MKTPKRREEENPPETRPIRKVRRQQFQRASENPQLFQKYTQDPHTRQIYNPSRATRKIFRYKINLYTSKTSAPTIRARRRSRNKCHPLLPSAPLIRCSTWPPPRPRNLRRLNTSWHLLAAAALLEVVVGVFGLGVATPQLVDDGCLLCPDTILYAFVIILCLGDLLI